MTDWSLISASLNDVLSLQTLLIVLAGTLVGMLVGILPGFGAPQGLALCFPFAYGMPVLDAVLFFLAIYCAAEYGGSIPAILIRTPGTSSAAITLIDGYPMARMGLAQRALKISLVGGVVGGVLSTIIFVLLAATIAWVGLKFGPSEMFAVGIFGLSIIGGFFGKDAIKGFIATGIGVLLAMVGNSSFGGMRFTFDQAWLLEGIPLIVVIIGFLAVPEGIRLIAASTSASSDLNDDTRLDGDGRTNKIKLVEWIRMIPTMLRGTVIGTAVGVLPGGGATVASLVAYSEEKRWSKNGDKFGTGVDEGVLAPETSNNAIVAGALVPTLALGIPGSASTAILIGLLTSKGVVPGPLLFDGTDTLITSIFIGLIVCNLAMLAIGLFGARLWAQVSLVPVPILGPLVLLLMMIAVYADGGYIPHVLLALVFGGIGFLFEKLDFPIVPIVLGFVMAPIIERNLGRALAIERGDFLAVASHPITASILLLSLALAILSFRRRDT